MGLVKQNRGQMMIQPLYLHSWLKGQPKHSKPSKMFRGKQQMDSVRSSSSQRSRVRWSKHV